MIRSIYRQGDLLFTEISGLPLGLSVQSSNVIVEGEVTGHSHRLLEGSVLQNVQGTLFLEVLQATQVVHQEHRAITLNSGYYQVTRQREYTPEAVRMVSD